MQPKQTVTADDLAAALKDEHGSFLVQLGGQSSWVTSEHGHSITSQVPLGPPVTVAGESSQYKITMVTDEIIRLSEYRGRQGQGERGDRDRERSASR